ncbi:MAG: glycosyltransferase family 4 protein [Pseudomonadota bacterium]
MKLAFYAPMKSPDHPTPSGDRAIARLLLRALAVAGAEARLVSTLRLLDLDGSAERQNDLIEKAGEEAEWLVESLAPSPPEAWLTYHCHYRAPDLIGPVVSGTLGIPYLIVEPSISPKRRQGLWSRFAAASEAAIAHADCLLWTTERDRPALEQAGHGSRMTHLPAFLDPGDAVAPRPAGDPLRLLTVAMPRPGDKMESYRRLAAGLAQLDLEWELTVIGGGTGEAEAELAALFAPFRAQVAMLGTLTDPAILRLHMEQADLMVWPGVGEGVGMVWLEAQAAGCPVVAEEGPAARAAIPETAGGILARPDDPTGFARAIREAAENRAWLSKQAQAHIMAHHSLDAAATRLGGILAEVLR